MNALGRWCFENRRRVVASWVAAVVLLLLAGNAWGGEFQNDFRVADSESQEAFDRLRTSFPAFAGDPISFVFRSDAGIDDPAVRSEVEATLDEIAAEPGVLEVVSPYTGLALVDGERRTAIAQVRMVDFGPDVEFALVQRLIDRADRLSEIDGLDAAVGGPTAMFAETERPGSRETVGVVLALLVLLVTFGSLIAAGLPVVVALGGLGAGMAGIGLLTRVITVSTFAPGLAAMIGLGVGIDYALFIVTRYRQGLDEGRSPDEAVGIAVGTAGRAVVFAGATVVISLLGMLLIGVSMVVGLAVGAALAVGCTVVAAVTLLPAVLGFVGGGIDRFSVRRTRVRPGDVTGWHRWGRAIPRRPLPAMIGALVLLLALSAPALGLELSGPHFGGGPESQSSRRAYDLITDSFGVGYNGPLLLVIDRELPGVTDDLAQALAQRVAEEPGVEVVFPELRSPDESLGVLVAIPTSAPHDLETQALVRNLRTDVIPDVTGTASGAVAVSGVTALFADMADLLGRRLPVFIGVVIGLSFLLLMAVFRSVLVPVKAAVLNLLSISAAYGVVVVVFQWGWGSGLIGVDRPGPIMAFIPMMLFAILFGLSMDYEVFLLSRVREEYDRTGDNSTAVVDGLAVTGRVITAAAVIMVLIFSSFVLGDDPIIKTFGLGLAAAVLVDATVVRMVLVPATMELLGNANWWFPGWLERWVPRLDLEGSPVAESEDVPAAAPVVITDSVGAWLASLDHRHRGQAVAHLDRLSSNGAVPDGEVLVPLGRRRRSLALVEAEDAVVVDLKDGRGNHPSPWSKERVALLDHPDAAQAHREAASAARIGDAIRACREHHGISLESLAERADIAARELKRIESGEVGSTLGSVIDACAALDLVLAVEAHEVDTDSVTSP